MPDLGTVYWIVNCWYGPSEEDLAVILVKGTVPDSRGEQGQFPTRTRHGKVGLGLELASPKRAHELSGLPSNAILCNGPIQATRPRIARLSR
jgi:hypothetical protein